MFNFRSVRTGIVAAVGFAAWLFVGGAYAPLVPTKKKHGV